MLNDKNKNEWRSKVKTIFTEAQNNFANDEVSSDLDLGGAPSEDPAVDAPPIEPGTEIEEEEPTVKVTASLLKALLDYCSAPEDDFDDDFDDDVDDDLDVEAPVDETAIAPSSMSAPAMTTSSGIMENDDMVSDEIAPDEPVVDDEDGADVSNDEIVQRLIDLSAERGDEALDVDVLNMVFSPEVEGGDDLDGDLAGNVELPATTGDQTLPPAAPEAPIV